MQLCLTQRVQILTWWCSYEQRTCPWFTRAVKQEKTHQQSHWSSKNKWRHLCLHLDRENTSVNCSVMTGLHVCFVRVNIVHREHWMRQVLPRDAFNVSWATKSFLYQAASDANELVDESVEALNRNTSPEGDTFFVLLSYDQESVCFEVSVSRCHRIIWFTELITTCLGVSLYLLHKMGSLSSVQSNRLHQQGCKIVCSGIRMQ